MRYNDNGVWKNILPVADSAGIKYQEGAYTTPTGWSIVEKEEDCTNRSTLYFVTIDKVTKSNINAKILFNGAALESDIMTGLTYDFLNVDGEVYSTMVVTDTLQPAAQTIKSYIGTLKDSEPYWLRISYDTPISTEIQFTTTVNLKNANGDIIGTGWFPNTSLGASWTGSAYHDDYISERINFMPVEGFDYASFSDIFAEEGNYIEISVAATLMGRACLTGDTQIMTITGPQAIEDIKLGTMVLDENKYPTEVTKIYGHQTKAIYNIDFETGEHISCTYDHKFKTADDTVILAENITSGILLKTTSGTLTVANVKVIKKSVPVYEIATAANTYMLANSIICECEVI